MRPSLNYLVIQYLLNTKNEMHLDPIVVLNHFVAPGAATRQSETHSPSPSFWPIQHIVFLFRKQLPEKEIENKREQEKNNSQQST